MDSIHTTEYLDFRVTRQTEKTVVVGVFSRRSDALLGEVKWYGPWRQYTFFPAHDCIFNTGCMEDIIGMIKRLMEERKGS